MRPVPRTSWMRTVREWEEAGGHRSLWPVDRLADKSLLPERWSRGLGTVLMLVSLVGSISL